MKKLFEKYNRTLPVFAVLYSIYIMTKRIDPSAAMESRVHIGWKILDGWGFLLVVFLILLSGILYSLREKREWEYLYSFPLTKEQIYNETIGNLHRYTAAAGMIYGIAVGIKYRQIAVQDTAIHILGACIISVLIFFVKCVAAELCLLSFQRFWQGLMAAAAAFFLLWPMLLGNIGYLLQALLHIPANHMVLQQMFYETRESLRIPVALNYDGFLINGGTADGFLKHWNLWGSHYTVIVMVLSVVCLVAIMGGLFLAKHKFIKTDLAMKRLLTRMGHKENHIIVTAVISLVIFNGITSILLIKKVMYYAGTILYGTVFFTGKQGMLGEIDTLLYIETGQTLMVLALSIAVSSAIVALIWLGRRKIHEK